MMCCVSRRRLSRPVAVAASSAALFAAVFATPAAPLFAQAPATASSSSVDPAVIARIRDEGLNRSQVMKTLSYLTDVIGPRLTASPALKRANEWTRDTMAGWGMQNAHLEAWGPFGRGWTLKRFSAQVVAPQTFPLIAYPKAWSPGTPRGQSVIGPVVYLDADDEAGLEKWRGKLRGAIVLTAPMRELKARFEPLATRRTDAELTELANAEAGAGRRPGAAGRLNGLSALPPAQQRALTFPGIRAEFLRKEGAAVLVDPSRAGDGGTLFVQSASVYNAPNTPREKRASAWDKNPPATLPQIVMANEHYNRLVRMIQQGETPRMAVDLDVAFSENDNNMAFNTVAEIPGTDKKDEIVMLGGHMDSWHGGTGATDNGAGVAVAMEAARILRALNLAPRRTIRVALWSGEEQGLFGSRAYVAQHFGTMQNDTLKPGPEYDKLSAYFNLDNGTGKIRGVYLQGNEAAAPLFKDWLAPFAGLGATTLTRRGTGGTDHLSFDGIGLPGFQFIQDTIEYDTRTHHSNMDVFDRIQADDLKQAATILAAFVYQTAMQEEKFPRKSLK